MYGLRMAVPLALSLLSSGCTGGATVGTDEAAIHQLYADWFRAMEAGDAQGLASLLAEDAIVKMPGSPPIKGRDRVEADLLKFHEQMNEVVEYRVEEIEIRDDLAYARVFERATVTTKAGKPVGVFEGTHLAILTRTEEGRWLVLRDVGSLNSWP